MKKICLSVVGMFLLFIHAHAQYVKDSALYKSRKLKLDEINIVSSYYDQTADKSAVMGGRTDSKGIGNVTDLSTGIDLKFVGYDRFQRKNSLGFGLGIDHHTAASQAYVDTTGKSKNDGSRIYPTLDWTIENPKKGTEFGIGAYYSAEHHYYHSLGLHAEFSKKTASNGLFGAKLSGYFDNIKMITPAEFSSVDSVDTGSSGNYVVYVTTASGHQTAVEYNANGQVVSKSGNTTPSKSRDTYTAEFSFAQVLNPRMQVSIVTDVVYQKGYLGLPFHRVYFNDGKDTVENLPQQRFKLPIGLRLNYFFGDNIILRSYYRFYLDNWGLVSHTASLEAVFKITPFFSLSPFYRFYTQSAANYFAPYATHTANEQYYTSNYALASFVSNSYGMGMRLAPPKGILFQGFSALELRYDRYEQSTNLQANNISVNMKFK